MTPIYRQGFCTKKIVLSTTVKRYKLIFGQTGFRLQPTFGLLIIFVNSLYVPSLKLEDVSHVRRAGILVEKPRWGFYHSRSTLSSKYRVVASCVNTEFWLDKITRESDHTRELRRQLLQNKFALGWLNANMCKVCCKKDWAALCFLKELFAIRKRDFLEDRFERGCAQHRFSNHFATMLQNRLDHLPYLKRNDLYPSPKILNL